MKRVLVFIDEEAVEESIDLLETAGRMYGARNCRTYALAAGGRWGEASSLFDVLLRPKEGTVRNYEAPVLARCVEALHERFGFDAVLVPATHFGRMMAPRAAARLRSGLVADVTAVHMTDGDVVMERPAFSGRLLASVVCRGPGPVMMTVRPRTFEYMQREDKNAEIVGFELPKLRSAGIRLLERRERALSRDIRESEILISGGGGALRSFPLLEELAAALGGMVAASRKAVDRGVAPRGVQVGQSGKIVSPRLYMALGISGSAQHVAGLKNAEFIIAVNTDVRAPICSMADIVVEGDGRLFIEGLLDRIRASREEDKGGTE